MAREASYIEWLELAQVGYDGLQLLELGRAGKSGYRLLKLAEGGMSWLQVAIGQCRLSWLEKLELVKGANISYS